MKNILRIFVIFLFILISSFCKFENDEAIMQCPSIGITNADSYIYSNLLNDIPYIINNSNNKQEISQSKDENSSQYMPINKHNCNQNLLQGIFSYIRPTFLRQNTILLASNLEHFIYTRAP